MTKTLSMQLLFWVCVSGSVGASDLQQMYELALRNDPVLAAARAARESALESRPQALSQLLPNLFVTGDTNRVRRNLHSSPAGSNDRTFGKSQASLGLVQPLYNRERWIQLKQTENTIASANADYAAAQEDLILRTAEAYFNVLESEDRLISTRANKEANERQLDQAKQRFEVGLIAITDVHEAQAAYDNARAEVIEAENLLDNAWEALYVIVQPDTVAGLARLRELIPLQMPEPQDMTVWSEAAQSQNLGIIAALNDAQFARKNIELQRSGHYPTVDMVGSLTKDNTTGSDGSHLDTSSIGVQLNLPLYTGGSVSSQVRQARQDFEQAQEILDARRRTVNQDVRDSYRGVESAIGLVEALKASTISAQSALDATQAGYEVGTRTIIDVLNVQRRKFESDFNYAQARYAYILNGLRLKQAASILSEIDIKGINEWLDDNDLSKAPPEVMAPLNFQ